MRGAPPMQPGELSRIGDRTPCAHESPWSTALPIPPNGFHAILLYDERDAACVARAHRRFSDGLRRSCRLRSTRNPNCARNWECLPRC